MSSIREEINRLPLISSDKKLLRLLFAEQPSLNRREATAFVRRHASSFSEGDKIKLTDISILVQNGTEENKKTAAILTNKMTAPINLRRWLRKLINSAQPASLPDNYTLTVGEVSSGDPPRTSHGYIQGTAGSISPLSIAVGDNPSGVLLTVASIEPSVDVDYTLSVVVSHAGGVAVPTDSTVDARLDGVTYSLGLVEASSSSSLSFYGLEGPSAEAAFNYLEANNTSDVGIRLDYVAP